ncbi:hypothetical protein [Caldinitratiruptor microaerophilus]|uniref:Antitoxin n=1 Tax=Caldinitratiruptor microaerophilus TaxID=671077 RepID=A0AA35G7X3_9FIRM|nr:hypothetical protein [Caldinitratiruptor microaerophilus]BDG59793.1 hypothetical protein caldi_08830 [Caldinitratiruptor microaerophilus]
MTETLIRVGVREFREELAKYLESRSPVAITRHGRTVGYYIPAEPEPDEAELEALKRAVARLEGLLAERGISEEEILREFRTRRARR